jgi:hypothetical protein
MKGAFSCAHAHVACWDAVCSYASSRSTTVDTRFAHLCQRRQGRPNGIPEFQAMQAQGAELRVAGRARRAPPRQRLGHVSGIRHQRDKPGGAAGARCARESKVLAGWMPDSVPGRSPVAPTLALITCGSA